MLLVVDHDLRISFVAYILMKLMKSYTQAIDELIVYLKCDAPEFNNSKEISEDLCMKGFC